MKHCVKCGTLLVRRQQRFCSVECNRESKQLWMKDMRQRYTYTLRRGRFQGLITQLLQRGAITHASLLELAALAYRAGYHASDKKHLSRRAKGDSGMTWNASAKRGRTGETYEIRTVADFLKVPERRRRVCLREFHAWLTVYEHVPQLIHESARALGGELPDDAILVSADVFRWMDDGKATITVNM